MTDLPQLNRRTAQINKTYPERIVQFGAGNFLRGFADWIIDILNEKTDFASSVVVVKVTPGTYRELDAQDGLFHVHLEGIQNDEFVSDTRLIRCISRTVYPYQNYADYVALAQQPDIRFLISNTTEAGIQYNEADRPTDTPPDSFPAKMALFLYERYRHFNGAADKGCIIIPTELIDDNGTQLQGMIRRYAQQWMLDADFTRWLDEHNVFCNTLVDRIVPGFPQDKSDEIFQRIGFHDDMLLMAEPYHNWIIEAPESIENELPVERAGLNVHIVPDATPHRQTKVRILNGLHTSMVPIGYFLGLESVRESVDHPALGQFLRDEAEHEIIPSMDLPPDELRMFARDVFDRFRNPSIHHRLLSIAAKTSAKVKARLLPTLTEYHTKHDALPERIVFALAAFIRFYQGEWQGQAIPLSDDENMIDWFRQQWQTAESTETLVQAVLKNEALWGRNISTIPGLSARLCDYLEQIDSQGISSVLEQINGQAK